MASFDDLLTDVGELGKYQIFVYVLICLAAIPPAFHVNISLFLTPILKYRCAIPNLPTDIYANQGSLQQRLLNETIPRTYDNASCTYVLSSCDVYKGNDTQQCTDWVYDRSVFASTAIEEYGLVCDWADWRTYTMMAPMVGMLIGSFVCGAISDRFGRKRAFLIMNCLSIVIGTLAAWAPNLAYFTAYRLMCTFCTMGMYLCIFVLGVEMVGPSKRMYAGIIINFFWAIGVQLLAGIAYGIRDWHYLQLTISVSAVSLISYIWIIPESPRWLMANGRHTEAMAVVETIAKYNGTTVPQKYYDPEIFTESTETKKADRRHADADGAGDAEAKGQPVTVVADAEGQESGKLWHLCSTPRLALRSFAVVVNWIAVTLAYYGLFMYAGSMSSDLYLNFVLSGLVEFPAYALCLLLLDRLGRRWLHSGSMVLSGVACICSIFPVVFGEVEACTVAGINIPSMVLSLLGRLGAATGFATIYIFSSELAPTTLRNSAMGFSSMAARIGGIAAPYIATLNVGGKMGSAFPLLIFGVFTLTAGLLSLVLPETLNQHLPDTVKDAEKFGQKKNKYHLDIQGHDNTGVDASM